MQARLQRHVLTAAVFASLALGSSDFSERAVQCEHSVVHLLQCCPDLDIESVCDHDTGCESDTQPVFTVNESSWIQNRTCAELTVEDGCEAMNIAFQNHVGRSDAF